MFEGTIPKISEEEGDLSDDSFSSEEESTATKDESALDHTHSNSNNCEVRDLSRNQNKTVALWRCLVIGILILCACFLCVGAYLYLSHDETDSFESAFHQYTETMAHSAQEMDVELAKSLMTVADQMTTYSLTTSSQWPRVTMPFFEQNVHKVRAQGLVEYLSVCPLVEEAGQSDWEAYASENQWWLSTDEDPEHPVSVALGQGNASAANKSIPSHIFKLDGDGANTTTDLGKGPYAVRWQMTAPPVEPGYINYDVISPPSALSLFYAMMSTRSPVASEVLTANATNFFIPATSSTPTSIVFHPITQSFQDAASIVGLLEVMLNWSQILSQLLPEGTSGVFYALRSSCGDIQSYEISEGEFHYRGEGNLHDVDFSHMETEIDLIASLSSSDHLRPCTYSVLAYPSSELRNSFDNNIPEITAVVACMFVTLAIFFFLYDMYVQRRNKRMVHQAIKTNQIVSSFFPKSIRDRLINQEGKDNSTTGARRSGRRSNLGVSVRLRSFLSGVEDSSDVLQESEQDDKPIADLFPNCTVLFADLVGFTAWSSMREPTQVLLLLESIYRAFDEIAKRRRVFKVETIGDCYVAVTGIPDPMENHALVMAKFARDIMFKAHQVTKSLEVSLGPDTGDLSIRIGMHSGPVTAGVLRADRLRFQLFGDTVNTASRMESTGFRGCVHVSKESATAIAQAGKATWVKERGDKVTAKGKGELTTFWLSLQDSSSGASYRRPENILSSMDFSVLAASGQDMSLSYFSLRRRTNNEVPEKTKRLIKWNSEVLHRILRQIAATRKVSDKSKNGAGNAPEEAKEQSKQMVIEEVSEVIRLPKFNTKRARIVAQAEEADMNPLVEKQLHDFVAQVAAMYHDNPFHSFEHASHVSMSVTKLLSRIVAPAEADLECDESERKVFRSIASKMHDHTYGITSDPLTQFAVVLSALIHDVDHLGVANTQLVKEDTDTAQKYKGKSVAEQNSVDLSWNLLMKPEYEELRKAIAGNKTEWKRFRQLVVNSVMATDIVDKELKELRNARWDKAFSDEFTEEDPATDRNRKATIVIEHLIQASDVSHTMQHWHIYRKWNERLFRELYRAYKQGRAEKDPSEFWYKGEIGFFDFYIIPLAKKLKECGVFGVSSDEYLNYAENNLAEWKAKGEKHVEEMLAAVKVEYENVRVRKPRRGRKPEKPESAI